jgi:hypothetical protein
MGDSVHRYTLRQVGTLQVLSFTMVGTILWSKAKYCGLSPLSVPHRCCFFTLSCLGVEGWFGKFKTLLPTPFNALFLIYGIVIPVLFSLALVKVFLCVDNCSNIFLYFVTIVWESYSTIFPMLDFFLLSICVLSYLCFSWTILDGMTFL